MVSSTLEDNDNDNEKLHLSSHDSQYTKSVMELCTEKLDKINNKLEEYINKNI
jgi:hypothetical protein